MWLKKKKKKQDSLSRKYSVGKGEQERKAKHTVRSWRVTNKD